MAMVDFWVSDLVVLRPIRMSVPSGGSRKLGTGGGAQRGGGALDRIRYYSMQSVLKDLLEKSPPPLIIMALNGGAPPP